MTWAVAPKLLIGAQVNVNARRDSVLLGGLGVRWKFAEDWLLSLWFPRPRIEFKAAERWVLFAGATIASATFVVGEDFGTIRSQPELNGAAVDFQEVRAGGGLRYQLNPSVAMELSGGWTIDRRYHFHEQARLLNGDGAPYLQFSFGWTR